MQQEEVNYIATLPLEYWSILVTIIDCEVFSNGPDKKESTKRNEHVGMQKRCVLYYSLYYTSDWFKQQILWRLHKAACP